MSRPRKPFTPSPAYRIFLDSLIKTREERGFTQEQLATFLSLPVSQIQAHEAGQLPLAFLDVRAWLLALDMPFTQFTQQLDETLDATLTHDQQIEPLTESDAPADPYGSDDDGPVSSSAPDIRADIRDIRADIRGEQGAAQLPESSSDSEHLS